MPSPISARSSIRASRNLVSIAQAADYASVSTKTIRRRISDGSLTGYRLGPRTIRLDLDEVDESMRPMPNAKSA